MLIVGVLLAMLLWPLAPRAESPLPGGELLPGWTVKTDCDRGTIQRNASDNSVTLCVREMTKEVRRCEVYLTGPDIRQRFLDLRFELKLNEAAANPTAAVILFQIHSRPDAGEQWRCPMAALRSLPGDAMDLGGAFDPNSISKPAANGCIGPGSSIQGYRVFRGQGAEASKWIAFHLRYRLALDGSGEAEAFKDGKLVGRRSGPNAFNDESPPFLKLGIYGEPSPQPGPFCSTIRNFRLNLAG
ncbi:heparin lyase I family protein [Bosea sp. Root381]|uniref:heparin lyase I family protein n=1 Tax=Bosea sp. Root381 TaxID=1736524 RepID=UPI0009EA5AB7|nr:heparin lyase I family protein [Bosea sp. Root381]